LHHSIDINDFFDIFHENSGRVVDFSRTLDPSIAKSNELVFDRTIEETFGSDFKHNWGLGHTSWSSEIHLAILLEFSQRTDYNCG
jgi:hypothetical protein